MATWSREQSQGAGMCKGASSGMKVKCSTYLVRNERIRLANKKENARIIRWAEEAPTYKKVREYSDTIEVKLSRKAKRALGGRVLRNSTRVELARKATARNKTRAALQAIIDGSKQAMPI